METREPSPTYRFGVKFQAECVAQADDIIEIKWSKVEGVSRASENVNENVNTLSIPALVSMDLGTYVCVARRSTGEAAQNSIVFSRHADHGGLFTYEVQGPTEPVDSFSPTSEGEEESAADDDNREEQQEDGQRGEKERGNEQEEGTEASQSAPVVKILNVKERNVNVAEGQSLELECQVQGSSQVEFGRHNEQLPRNGRVDSRGNLRILRFVFLGSEFFKRYSNNLLTFELDFLDFTTWNPKTLDITL